MTRLSLDDFFDGLIAALAAKELKTVSIRDTKFDRALASVFEQLSVRSKSLDLDLRFRIRAHPLHGDSPTVRHAIADAAQRDVVSLDNPSFLDIRFKLSKSQANDLLASLPGGPEIYEEIANDFLSEYDLVSK